MSILNLILPEELPAVDNMTEQVADSLRQAADTAAQVLTTAAPSVTSVQETTEQVVKNLSIWDLTMAGGWLMIPLALLAVVSIYIFFERLFAINRANRQDKSFMDRIKDFIHRGDVDQALKLCQDTDTPTPA